jgi:hypothetical protein
LQTDEDAGELGGEQAAGEEAAGEGAVAVCEWDAA